MASRPDIHDLIRTIQAQGVIDQRVLDAFRVVLRADFVPPDLASFAYEDRPLPIARFQVTTQPSLVARMVEALGLEPADRALEVGAGLGFQAAILSRLCDQVVTVERFPDLADAARENLRRAGITNVLVLVGDGTLGAPDLAPFQAIIGAAAAPRVPPPLAEQLDEGGRLVLPIGPGGGEEVKLFRKEEGRLIRLATVIPASFVRMVGG
ncbi:MAG TPA: protein-L-isoaspartate(D-aspartate) O-methyltransferase, partial [Blastocatellia bacterium]|nr:protein-L-isoaspartate(D-aspartate) O-methyltransferase [Blastocatellia bacterium]